MEYLKSSNLAQVKNQGYKKGDDADDEQEERQVSKHGGKVVVSENRQEETNEGNELNEKEHMINEKGKIQEGICQQIQYNGEYQPCI